MMGAETEKKKGDEGVLRREIRFCGECGNELRLVNEVLSQLCAGCQAEQEKERSPMSLGKELSVNDEKKVRDAVDVMKRVASEVKKPRVKLTGTDGNVFALAGRVMSALRKAGQVDKAKEFSGRLFKCKSYGEALKLMGEFVEVS